MNRRWSSCKRSLCVCCPKCLIGSACFPCSSITLQQVHQDWVLIPVLPRPQQELLECQEVQIKLSFADLHQRSFHVVDEFWLLKLCEKLRRRELSKPCDLVIFSSLLRSLSPTTLCLRDLGEPIDLKSPMAETLMLCRSPLVQLLLTPGDPQVFLQLCTLIPQQAGFPCQMLLRRLLGCYPSALPWSIFDVP